MPGTKLGVVSLTGLGDYLDSVISGFYGASRLLLLPAITGVNRVDCELLNSLCCGNDSLTVNYRVVGKVVIIRAVLGSIVKNEVPCMVNIRRMPPLARFVESGIVSVRNNFLVINYWSDYMKIIDSSEEASRILELLSALRRCGAYTVRSLSRCVKMDDDAVFRTLITLRMLYPALIEVALPSGSTINSVLKELGVGKLLDVHELFNTLMVGNVGNAVVIPSNLLKMLSPIVGIKPRLGSRLSRKRSINSDVVVIRSGASRYSIPSILGLVNFNNAVVADVGCGFGVKGTYGLKRGASFVILIDIDEGVLRLRRSGWAVDRVVADARRLPLRDYSVDVVIFWNVINFIKEKEFVINEVRRICRGEIALSVYNAINAHWSYDYEGFISELLSLGKPIAIKRVGSAQFQAVVRVAHDKD